MQWFMSKSSPHFDGQYHEFHHKIASLLPSGTTVLEFYCKAKELDNKITLAWDQSGTHSTLMVCYMSSLHSFKSGEFWMKLQMFHCDPNHIAMPLPFSFEDVFNLLEICGLTLVMIGLTILNQNSNSNSSRLIHGIAGQSAQPPSSQNHLPSQSSQAHIVKAKIQERPIPFTLYSCT